MSNINRRDFLAASAAVVVAPAAAAEAAKKCRCCEDLPPRLTSVEVRSLTDEEVAACQEDCPTPESLLDASSQQFWTGKRWLHVEEVVYRRLWGVRDENGRQHYCACGKCRFSSKESLEEAERGMREHTGPGLTRLHTQVETDPERLTIEYVLHMAEVQPPWIGDRLQWPQPDGSKVSWRDIGREVAENRLASHPGEF